MVGNDFKYQKQTGAFACVLLAVHRDLKECMLFALQLMQTLPVLGDLLLLPASPFYSSALLRMDIEV